MGKSYVTAEYLLYLLDIEEQFLRQLERQFSSTEQSPSTPQNPFPYTWEILWKDSGMADKYQVKKAIIRDFVEGAHYRWNGKVLEISTICYQILMINFRPEKKADISKLPRLLQMDRDELFAYSARKATKNGRNGKADAVDRPTIPGFPLQ